MHIVLVGLDHQTAPVALRERVAVSGERLPGSLVELRRYTPQGIILSTCNRTEIYTIADGREQAAEAAMGYLGADLSAGDGINGFVQVADDRVAVEHIYRVAAGLESLVVGEHEVLGQVGQALAAAERAGLADLALRHLFQGAIRTGRRVRRETGLGRNALSVSAVALELASAVVGDLKGTKMVVIGAGEAGRLVVKVARERGVSPIVLATRRPAKAASFSAEMGMVTVGLGQLAVELAGADIVVSCSGAPHWTLDVRRVKQALKDRPGRPLVVIDIAVPRNVEPAVRQIQNVRLYDMDDLSGIAESNRRKRAGEVPKAESLIEAGVEGFLSWWRAFRVQPVVSALMGRAEGIRAAQLEKTLKKLHPLSEEERESLEAMTRSIVTRILKDPVHHLQANPAGNGEDVEVVRRLFGLDG